MHSSHNRIYIGNGAYGCSSCKVDENDPRASNQCSHSAVQVPSPMNTLPSFMIGGDQIQSGQIWIDYDDNEVKITAIVAGDKYPIKAEDPDNSALVFCYDSNGQSSEYSNLKRLKDDLPDYYDGYINVYANNETAYFKDYDDAVAASRTRKTLFRIEVDASRGDGMEDDND